MHPTGIWGRKPETALMAYIRHALAGVHGAGQPHGKQWDAGFIYLILKNSVLLAELKAADTITWTHKRKE